MAPPIRRNGLDVVRPVRERSTAPAPTKSYDVTVDSPSKTELASMRRTNPVLATTIEKAQKAYGDLLAKGAKISVTTPAGNGGQPVVTLVPPGFDPSKPAKVQTHYHGDRTSAAEPGGITSKAVHDLVARDPQTVFVLPEARGNIGQSGTDWNNATDQRSTTAEALAAAGVTNVGERTVSAHSAGGRALARALEKGNVQADRVVLNDCLYEPAASQIKAGLKKLDGLKEVVVIHGTNDLSRSESMAKAFGDRGKLIKVPTTQGVDPHNGSVRWYLDGRTDLRKPMEFKDRFD